MTDEELRKLEKEVKKTLGILKEPKEKAGEEK